MKLKSKASTILIVLGTLFIAYSVFLFVENRNIEKHADEYSKTILDKFYTEIVKEDTTQDEIVKENTLDIKDTEKVLIENNLYIGVIKIPSLNLELPIQSDWSYEKLKDTPCVYKEEPFSIAGHNYTAHFGKISNLKPGDQVIFEDTQGTEIYYTVREIIKVYEDDINSLANSDYDLTLFTCNYSNDNERILVRLDFSLI